MGIIQSLNKASTCLSIVMVDKWLESGRKRRITYKHRGRTPEYACNYTRHKANPKSW